jgi:hypothetical protein
MNNIFYHYTAKHLIGSIKKEGLTKGKLPFVANGYIALKDSFQWLTTSANPKTESVLDAGTLPYSRLAYKIKIRIPVNSLYKVLPFEKICEILGNRKIPGFDDYPRPDWYCFFGMIPKEWFVNIRATGISK